MPLVIAPYALLGILNPIIANRPPGWIGTVFRTINITSKAGPTSVKSSNMNFNVDQAVDSLKRDGLFISRGHFTHQTIKKLNRDFDFLLSHQIKGMKEVRHPSGRFFRINCKYCESSKIPEIMKIFSSRLLRDIAASYLPEGSIFNHDIVATHDFKSVKITDDHFDMFRSLKFMIYLLDTNEQNGVFSYARRTHIYNSHLRKQHLRIGGSLKSLPNIRGGNEDISFEPINGPAGTLIIFDTEGFHRADRLAEATERRILRNRCVFANQPAARPIKYSRQWIREHWRKHARIFGPNPPHGRRSTGGSAQAK